MKFFKNNVFLFFISLISGLVSTNAQDKDTVLPKANEEYANNKYVDAEANYRISSSKFTNKTISNYNLGNAIYKQNQASEAKFSYAKAIENNNSREQKHKAFHNLGNVFMKEKDYSQAVEAYKNALRNNPSDEETRYNFALAKKMLKDNPPKNDDKNKDKDKDKGKDKKDENKDNNNDKKEGDNNKKDPNKGDKPDNSPPKPAPGSMSKERLENLMDAINNEEKKIQGKVNANKQKGKPVDTEKDW